MNWGQENMIWVTLINILTHNGPVFLEIENWEKPSRPGVLATPKLKIVVFIFFNVKRASSPKRLDAGFVFRRMAIYIWKGFVFWCRVKP